MEGSRRKTKHLVRPELPDEPEQFSEPIGELHLPTPPIMPPGAQCNVVSSYDFTLPSPPLTPLVREKNEKTTAPVNCEATVTVPTLAVVPIRKKVQASPASKHDECITREEIPTCSKYIINNQGPDTTLTDPLPTQRYDVEEGLKVVEAPLETEHQDKLTLKRKHDQDFFDDCRIAADMQVQVSQYMDAVKTRSIQKYQQDIRKLCLEKSNREANIRITLAASQEHARERYFRQVEHEALKTKQRRVTEEKKNFDTMINHYIMSDKFQEDKAEMQTLREVYEARNPSKPKQLPKMIKTVSQSYSADGIYALENIVKKPHMVCIDGENIDISPIEKGKNLSADLLRLCIQGIVKRHVNAQEGQETFTRMPPSFFTYQIQVQEDQNGKILKKNPVGWNVDKSLIGMIHRDSNEHYVAVTFFKNRWSLLHIDQSENTIISYGKSNDKLRDGLQLLQTELETSLGDRWDLKCLPGEFANANDQDTGVVAAINFEQKCSINALTGVRSIGDYRQKLKWRFIEEACNTSIQKSVTDENGALIQSLRDQIEVYRAELKSKEESSKEDGHQISLPNDSDKFKVFLKTPLDDILKHEPLLQKTEDGHIICLACYNPDRSAVNGKMLLPGPDTPYATSVSRKRAIAQHLVSTRHHLHASQTLPEATFKIGMNLGRAAYHAIKYTQGQRSYEVAVAADDAKEVSIGDKNHSCHFAGKMVSNFADVLRNRLKELLGRPLQSTGLPPPVAIIADKSTPNRETLHIIGLVTIMNGNLTDFLLDCKEAQAADGKGLAKAIIDVMLEYFSHEELQSRLTAGAFDGQYFKLKVPQHIVSMLEVSDSQRDLYTFSWDPAHLIELAGRNARGERPSGGISVIGVDWIRDVVHIVQKVGSKLKWGKAWKDLRAVFAEGKENEEIEERNLLRFKQFSQTRFTSYFHDFLYAVYNNYPVICKSFASANKSQVELDSVTSADFVLGLSFLLDMYKEVQICSKIVQQVRILPWQIDAAVTTLLSNLKSMEELLKTDKFWIVNPRLSLLNSCVSDLIATSCFKGIQVKVPARKLRSNSSEAECFDAFSQECAKKFSNHLKDFTDALELRFSANKPKLFEQFARIFCISQIMADVECKAAIESVFQAFKSLLPEELTFEAFQFQYGIFVDDVKRTFASKSVSRDEEYRFYMNLLSNPCRYREIAVVLSHACAKTSCESVSESMSSQISNILHRRGKLNNAKLNDESFIVHNGPTSGPGCNRMVAESLDRHFGGRSWWNFEKLSPRDPDSGITVSKVVDRINSTDTRISFENERDN